jgi:hypothetical protein
MGDTVCIDKSSSAELSEAINSMFEWYRGAQVCYAYLADVSSDCKGYFNINAAVRRSRWFTRGWTLQELLAPASVIFFNESWIAIGTKSSFSDLISSVTGIRGSDMVNFRNANVAVKMSWASNRETTRTEDIAYCLLGLFGVNMPLLYGEGSNAFLRLQLEILKISDDETIFAWEAGNISDTGLLAFSPANFRHCGDIRAMILDKNRPEYSMTNKGLRIELLLLQKATMKKPPSQEIDIDLYLAPLNCTRDPRNQPIAIILRKQVDGKVGLTNGFSRCSLKAGVSLTTLELSQNVGGSVPPGRSVRYTGSAHLLETMQRHTVYVKQPGTYPDSSLNYRPRRFSIRYPSSRFFIYEVRLRSGLAGWEEGEPGESGIWLDSVDEAAVILFDVYGKRYREEGFAIFVRKLPDDSAGVDLAIDFAYHDLSEVLGLFKEQMRPGLRTDQVYRHLATGALISVTLTPMAVSGEKQFLVDVRVLDTHSDYPRTFPAKAGAAKHIDDQQHKIEDQVQGYAPLRPSSPLGASSKATVAS